MRLTLRTLLAFRDGVLDPKDAAVLEAKIQESSTAQQISQRIEQDMRNRKIAPIPVDAREFGFEANRVAEFLDDTIPTEILPEMERQCLENSMLLCEIGCCHQILSRALTIPATVPNSLRQRVRNLASQPISHSGNLNRILESHGQLRRLDPANIALGSANTTSSSSISDSQESMSLLKIPGSELRPSGIELSDGLGRQVPEYLIGSDRAWMKRVALAALLLISLVVVGAYAIGPIGRVQALLKKADRDNVVEQSKLPFSPVDELTTSNVIVVGKKESDEVVANPSKMESDKSDENSMPDTNSLPLPNTLAEESAKSSEPSELSEMDKSSLSVAESEAARTATASSVPRMQWLPLTKESGSSIVLKRTVDPKTNVASWTRMSAGQFVEVGQRLVILPLQRTEINIEPSLRWLSAGENELELLPSKDSASSPRPRVSFQTGRALVFASPGTQALDMECNGHGIEIQFDKPDSSIAIETITTLVPMDDAALADGKLETASVVRLFCVQGNLDYSTVAIDAPNAISEKGSLNVGQYIQLEKGKGIVLKELTETPKWFRSSVERPIDKLAIADLQKALNECPADEIDSELLKLTGRRQAEMAAIASRTRMMLGNYSHLFSSDGVFNRKELRIHWQTLLGQLQQSFGSEENRARFVEKIREDSPGRANTILTLLVPKSQSQLVAGADKLLVESLSSSSMDERILAITQLTSITNKSLGYQPDKNPTDTIPAWRKVLSKNEIRYPEAKTANKVPN